MYTAVMFHKHRTKDNVKSDKIIAASARHMFAYICPTAIFIFGAVVAAALPLSALMENLCRKVDRTATGGARNKCVHVQPARIKDDASCLNVPACIGQWNGRCCQASLFFGFHEFETAEGVVERKGRKRCGFGGG